jgi:hypothetical protein
VAEEQVLCTAQRAKAPISAAGAAESRQHAVTADGAWDRVGTRLGAGPVSCGESLAECSGVQSCLSMR